MIDVQSEVKIYERDGEDVRDLNGPKMIVKSHWNRDEFVVIKWAGGKSVTVVARDLKAAIENAVRTAR